MAERVLGDRFVLVTPIGRGGMGTVWRALDRATGEDVAVKLVTLDPLLSSSARVRARFDREAALLAKLEHPAIVRYVAHGVAEGGDRFLAMEWIDGVDLERHLASTGALDAGATLVLARELASALGAMHRAGIVHRDVKPANILLSRGDVARPKLLDLGVADEESRERLADEPRFIVGTLGYMAPEQARGAKVDARSDVFSLGCVLYECLAGRPAFTGETATALALKILVAEIPPLSGSGVLVHPAVEALLARMLDKEPRARPENGVALVAEVDRAVRDVALTPSRVVPAARPSIDATRLSTEERRVVSALLVPGAAAVVPRDATIDAEPDTHAALGPMLDMARATGGRTAQLRDGTLLVFFEGVGNARDQAVSAARAALRCRAALGDRAAVVATGVAELAGYLPTGAVIDAATSLLARAAPGEISLDELTARLLGPAFVTDESSAPIRLVEERAGDAAMRFTLMGRPSTLVGREEAQRSILRRVRGSLDGGRATAVLVEGASGIGKTRLLFEVVRRVEEESRARLTVWRTGADLATARHPWSLVARAAGSAAPAIAQIVERERARGHEGDFPLGEFFAELLHAPVDEPSLMLRAAREDPALMRDQLRRTIRTIARDTLGFGPLLVVVDDAQFGDRESLDALALLLEESDENAGLCVLASVRDDVGVAPAWRGAHRVALGPLPTEARLELLLGALGESADVSRLALLASRSEGSPFWLEELARTEAEGATEELPATVVASVQSRLERLDRDARRLLRAASVFGGVFPLAPAAALAGLSRGSKEAALRALVDAEVLVEAQDGRFDIRHDITRRAAYGMLTEEDRLAAHAAVARWLESEDGSEPRLVADHFERAGLAREAVPHHAKAAVVALRSSDFGGAKTHAARGLEGSSEDETRGVLYHVLAEAAYWAGDTDGALEHAANVRRLAAPGSELWLDAARIEGALAIRRGLMDDVLGIARSLADAEPVPGGERAFAGTAARLASHTYLAGDGALAGRLLARAEALLAASSERWPVVLATLHDARARRAELAHDHVGERAERREAVWAFDEVGDRRRGCISRTNLGVAELHLGLFEEARRSLEDARTIAVELGLEVAAAAAECNLGLVLFFVGDEARARLMLDASTARSKIAGDKRFEGACAAHLARLELAAGRVTGALHAGEEAARLLASSPTLEGYALAALADACLATGDVVRAVASSEQAAESARARALEEGDLYARLVHARALRAAGRRDEAVAALRETADELRARAARLDVPEVRRAFLERIPEHAEILALERELGTPLPG